MAARVDSTCGRADASRRANEAPTSRSARSACSKVGTLHGATFKALKSKAHPSVGTVRGASSTAKAKALCAAAGHDQGHGRLFRRGCEWR